MSEMNELLVRMSKLESENRKMKWVAALLMMALAILGLLVLHRVNKRDKVEVSELIVKDTSGAVIARLGEDGHGTCLDLTVRSGASRAELCVDKFYGANPDLRNRNPETDASLSAGQKLYEGGDRFVPGLHIEGENGQNRLSVNVGSEAELFLGRSEGDNAVVLSGGHEAAVRIVGKDGKTAWRAPH
jgi:hypothetical protein